MIKRQLFQSINQLINWREIKPYLAFSFIWIIFSYPFFFQGRIPAPLDFLVNFYAPWDTYYDSPVKNPSLSDVVAQIIPWKIFNGQELRAGRIPLWNPYNLTGAPHLGNWQSGVLYPTTLLFLIFPDPIAWSLHVLLQPLLAGIFMILFLRQLKISPLASLLGAIVFAYGGFMTSWFEWGTLGHALLWLPLALYGILRTKDEGRRTKISALTIFSLTMSLLAGHPQTSIYVMIAVIGYYLYKNIRNDNKLSLFLVSCSLFLIPILLAAPQVFPSIQVYSESARNLVDGRSWAKAFLIKPADFLTFLAPDFFGNPTTRNSWSDFSYVEMQGYVGVVTFMLASVAVMNIKRPGPAVAGSSLIKFLICGIVIALMLATKNPISELIIDLNLPIISDSSPARIMGLINFSLAVLAAFGLDSFTKLIKEKKTKFLNSGIYFIAAILAGMWIWTFASTNPNALVTRRNLIFPSTVFAVFSMAYFLISKIFANPRVRTLFFVFCFLFFVSLDLFRFHHKFTPFSDIKNWYPEVPVITQLKSSSGRIFGTLEANLNLPFRLKSIDGYDPLINRNLVLMTYDPQALSTHNRITSPDFPKGNAQTIASLGKLGVKRVIDSAVPGGNSWDLRLWEYGDQFRLDWKDVKYQILYNTQAQESELEPISGMKNGQIKLFNLGILISSSTVFGMQIWKKYAK
ncbi:hypothetical protein HYU89_03010 [Candidatus Collierbacteria bacterium]|nr:hypothetical protein [Candidatus Collierbacteria bacterium]